MDADKPSAKTCPQCGSPDYAFRNRKKLRAEKDQPEATETKYRCKKCAHEWKVRTE
jgi:DNA-directed RNA polymerase subunit M/transcription elongation factor TFIIS